MGTQTEVLLTTHKQLYLINDESSLLKNNRIWFVNTLAEVLHLNSIRQIEEVLRVIFNN